MKNDLKIKPYFHFSKMARRRSRLSPLFALLFFLSGFFVALLSLEEAFGFSLVTVSHRIFTPNGDSLNDRVLFELINDEDELISGKIFDITGGFVAEMTVLDEDTISWQGQDRLGHTVPSGIYLYQLESQSQKISGSIVVAR